MLWRRESWSRGVHLKKISEVLDDSGGAGRLSFMAERWRKVREGCERSRRLHS